MPQPLIAVKNIAVSRRWYQDVLGLRGGHGGDDYEQLMYAGRMIMQLHRWDLHEHPHLGVPSEGRLANGMVLWFQSDQFDDVLQRIRAHDAQVLQGPAINVNANHYEVWLRDPDGYVVVIAGQRVCPRRLDGDAHAQA
jgi:catechol 2,3-dioxygenase-like lactoylglutathione lyase family enzyme